MAPPSEPSASTTLVPTAPALPLGVRPFGEVPTAAATLNRCKSSRIGGSWHNSGEQGAWSSGLHSSMIFGYTGVGRSEEEVEEDLARQILNALFTKQPAALELLKNYIRSHPDMVQQIHQPMENQRGGLLDDHGLARDDALPPTAPASAVESLPGSAPGDIPARQPDVVLAVTINQATQQPRVRCAERAPRKPVALRSTIRPSPTTTAVVETSRLQKVVPGGVQAALTHARTQRPGSQCAETMSSPGAAHGRISTNPNSGFTTHDLTPTPATPSAGWTPATYSLSTPGLASSATYSHEAPDDVSGSTSMAPHDVCIRERAQMAVDLVPILVRISIDHFS
ncbi:hypothetical protein M427DRAFT_75264 [Gonapodya prolifera JEL478]|uniref:Uncharacterized protein n=1 Tax=Gonapodya prolifera (strain JEL478) TaxID=1344416 RepID=A0A138ZYK3_GONPJ|nr:hypothetical protein M427DRAFT_75264 [Gonapodya prolifera JEL478]|eukprot:KXS09551.1 hypothetical protein M427DRAFT_75264 [Gonapodya prolifera JEL478]